jgi:hypothetical protein
MPSPETPQRPTNYGNIKYIAATRSVENQRMIQVKFDEDKNSRPLKKKAHETRQAPNAIPIHLSHTPQPQSNPWRTVRTNSAMTLHMVSHVPPSIEGVRIEEHFLCSLQSACPGNIISIHLLNKFYHANTKRGLTRSFRAAPHQYLFTNHTGRTHILTTITDFDWFIGGNAFFETFYVDHVSLLGTESMVLGGHFQDKHRIIMDYGSGQVTFPHIKILQFSEGEFPHPYNHPPYGTI